MSVLGQSLTQLGQAVSPAQIAQAMSTFQEMRLRREAAERHQKNIDTYQNNKKIFSPSKVAFMKAAEKMNMGFDRDPKSFADHQALYSGAAHAYSALEENAEMLRITPRELESIKRDSLRDLKGAPAIIKKIIAEKKTVIAMEKMDQEVMRFLGGVRAGKLTHAEALANMPSPTMKGRYFELEQNLRQAEQAGGLGAEQELRTSQEAQLIRGFLRDEKFMESFKQAKTLDERLAALRTATGDSIAEPRMNAFLNVAEAKIREENEQAASREFDLNVLERQMVDEGLLRKGKFKGEGTGLIPLGLAQDRLRTEDGDAIGGSFVLDFDPARGSFAPAIGSTLFSVDDRGVATPVGGEDALAKKLGKALKAKEEDKGLISNRRESNLFKGKMQNALDRIDRIIQDDKEIADTVEARRIRSEIAELNEKLDEAGATSWWRDVGNAMLAPFSTEAPRYTAKSLQNLNEQRKEEDPFIDLGIIQARLQSLLVEAQMLNAPRGN